MGEVLGGKQGPAQGQEGSRADSSATREAKRPYGASAVEGKQTTENCEGEETASDVQVLEFPSFLWEVLEGIL